MFIDDRPNEAEVAYLGLGANLGDSIQQLLDAKKILTGFDSTVSARCSSFYMSSPVGYLDQPHFINCVLELRTNLSAHELLEQTQMVESSLGRKRDPQNQNAPRLIDIDILLFGNITVNSDNLVIPHPRMYERRFVMVPLTEFIPSVATDYKCDELDQSVHKLMC